MGVLIGMSPMPFQFVGDSSMWKELSSEEKRRIKSVPDKTGDGKPDVMLEFFSGGAHCCFTYHTFELGDVVELRPALNTGHSGVKVWNRKTKAPFSMVTLDTVFAYWNASFAESPATEVILVFDNSAGEWRPDIESMKRPAPSMKTLERKAATMRSKINDEAYTGENSTRFDEVFWGEMLKLIYTGHAELAWRYLDMVWPKDKPGKEVFRGDFQKQLELGLFWTAVNGKDDGSLR